MHYVSSSYSHGIHAIRTATPLCTDDSGRAQMTSRKAHHAQPLRTFRDMGHIHLQRNRARRSACGQSPLREPPRGEFSMPSPESPAAPASARESWEWDIIPKSIIYFIGERPALPLPCRQQQPAAAAAAAAARVDAVANAAWRRCGASLSIAVKASAQTWQG